MSTLGIILIILLVVLLFGGFSGRFGAGHGLNMVGALQSGLLQAHAREIAGILAHAEVKVQQLHQTMTDIAVANNVDPPQPLSGGR